MKPMNNRGLTLIELICTVGLLAIVGLAGMAMMSAVVRMNHVVLLQEKQAREADLVIETVKYQLLRHPSTMEDDGSITVQATQTDAARTILFKVEPETSIPEGQSAEGVKYNLVMTLNSEHKQTLAADVLKENGFDIVSEAGSYRITLRFANGNSFEWIITPRITAPEAL